MNFFSMRKISLASIFTILITSYLVSLSSAAPYSDLTDVSEETLSAAALVSGAGFASRYNKDDCALIFGSANVEKVKSFKIEAGKVDFGDDFHVFGSPQGKAVLCWSIDGRVAIKGKLYSDNFRDTQTAHAEIAFRRTNGNWTQPFVYLAASQGLVVVSSRVEKVSPLGKFNKVRVRLKYFLPDTGIEGASTITVKTKTYNR